MIVLVYINRAVTCFRSSSICEQMGIGTIQMGLKGSDEASELLLWSMVVYDADSGGFQGLPEDSPCPGGDGTAGDQARAGV